MGERHALLVGTDFFQDEALSRLLAPKEDIKALREALISPNIGGFDSAEILLNSDYLAVQRALHELFDGRDREDLVLFYYSGHGLLDRHNRLYLSLHATETRWPAVGSLEAGYVQARMNDSASRRQIIILDCCHSGAFMAGAKRAKGDAALTAATFDPEGYGRYVLSACSATEFAFEDGRLRDGDPHARPRSVFTHCLVEGLSRGEAAPKSEVITLSALYQYVRRRVRHEGAPMEPQYWVDQGAGEIILARNPKVQRTQIDEIRDALEDPSRFTRLGAVASLAHLIAEAGGNAPEAEAVKVLLRERYRKEDSRQVASAIEHALEATQKAEQERIAREERARHKAEQERQEATQKAEQERIAREERARHKAEWERTAPLWWRP